MVERPSAGIFSLTTAVGLPNPTANSVDLAIHTEQFGVDLHRSYHDRNAHPTQ